MLPYTFLYLLLVWRLRAGYSLWLIVALCGFAIVTGGFCWFIV